MPYTMNPRSLHDELNAKDKRYNDKLNSLCRRYGLTAKIESYQTPVYCFYHAHIIKEDKFLGKEIAFVHCPFKTDNFGEFVSESNNSDVRVNYNEYRESIKTIMDELEGEKKEEK